MRERKSAFGLLLAALGLIGSAVVFADFDAGKAAWERKDYATALKEWSASAQAGDAASQYRLGNLYRYGTGVPKDDAKVLSENTFLCANMEMTSQDLCPD